MQYPWGTSLCSLHWELSLTWAEPCFLFPSVSDVVRNVLSLQSAFLSVCWQFPSKFNFRSNIMACSVFTVCFIHLPSHGQLVICGESVMLSFKQPRLNLTVGKYCGKREMWVFWWTCRKDWGAGNEAMELVLQSQWLMGRQSRSSRVSRVPLHSAETTPRAGPWHERGRKAKPEILSLQLLSVTAANWLWNMDEVILWLYTNPQVMTWTPWWDDPVTRYPVKQLTSQQMCF